MTVAKSTGKVKAPINILKGARVAFGLTQAELAAAAGIDLGTLNALESRRKQTRDEQRSRVQEALERRGAVFTNGDRPGFYLTQEGERP